MNQRNHSQHKPGPSLLEAYSCDVPHSHHSSPTNTLMTLNEALNFAKIKQYTQSTKEKNKKFFNDDFLIDYNENLPKIFTRLRKLFSMKMCGRTNYVVYEISDNKKMAFRLGDHNCRPSNFEQDNADLNISLYVKIDTFDVLPSDIEFDEYEILPDFFENHKQ